MLQALFVLSVCAVLVIWSRTNRSPAWNIAALICIVLAGFVHQLSYGIMADDAFISFRYANHLASGKGFVFNPGERVEGYSNFLPTVLFAAPFGGGFEKLPNFTRFQREFSEDYDGVSFRFKESRNDLGQYVNLLVLRSNKEKIINRLLSEREVELVTP